MRSIEFRFGSFYKTFSFRYVVTFVFLVLSFRCDRACEGLRVVVGGVSRRFRFFWLGWTLSVFRLGRFLIIFGAEVVFVFKLRLFVLFIRVS